MMASGLVGLGRRFQVRDHAKNRAEYEASAWVLTMEVIGQKLRERNLQPDELPPELLALVKKFDKK